MSLFNKFVGAICNREWPRLTQVNGTSVGATSRRDWSLGVAFIAMAFRVAKHANYSIAKRLPLHCRSYVLASAGGIR